MRKKKVAAAAEMFCPLYVQVQKLTEYRLKKWQPEMYYRIRDNSANSYVLVLGLFDTLLTGQRCRPPGFVLHFKQVLGC